MLVAALAGAEDAKGDRALVAMGEFNSSTGACSKDQAAAIGVMLGEALANTGKFAVLEDEADLEGANGVFIKGTVKKFERETGSGGLGGLRKKALGEVGIDEKRAKIEMELQVIDAGSGKQLKKKTIKKESAIYSADVTDGTWADGLDLEESLEEFAGEPMEGAIMALIEGSIDLVKDEVPEDYYSYSGTVGIVKATGDAEGAGEAGEGTAGGKAGGKAATGAEAEDMTLYTKYDFVPGNKVLFYDDMKGEEEGEFPFRWNLNRGVFEVVRLGKEYWIMCTDEGSIRPKIPDAPLPPKYTVEMEIYSGGPGKRGHYFHIYWVNSTGKVIGQLRLHSSQNTSLSIQGESKASKRLVDELSKGVHVMRIMATTRSIKCYIDNVRVANVPKVEGFNPVGFTVHADPWMDEDNPMLFRGFRFAEGGKSMREQLDETGKIITHGILFDTGSYTIKAESYKTLKEIARLLEDDPELRLSIEGHTDSDGSDEANMTLSLNRANSARGYLITNYEIDGKRLETKGWGESKAIDTNDTPEGKANNRRVELLKL
jgi:outer membrane protein OmpA-like peptidoglycan-associated protein